MHVIAIYAVAWMLCRGPHQMRPSIEAKENYLYLPLGLADAKSGGRCRARSVVAVYSRLTILCKGLGFSRGNSRVRT